MPLRAQIDAMVEVCTLLDALTLAATLWICYAMRFTELKRSYAKGLDTLPVSWVLGPCAVAALASAPRGRG